MYVWINVCFEGLSATPSFRRYWTKKKKLPTTASGATLTPNSHKKTTLIFTTRVETIWRRSKWAKQVRRRRFYPGTRHPAPTDWLACWTRRGHWTATPDSPSVKAGDSKPQSAHIFFSSVLFHNHRKVMDTHRVCCSVLLLVSRTFFFHLFRPRFAAARTWLFRINI